MGIIEDKLKLLPESSGVYVMLSKEGQVIYVGKAKNLKNRVRQYFHASIKAEKVMAMVKNVADFYYIKAPTETDALSLENNLIKKHKPRYNILLKDDKTYPYIKVNLKEDFPYFKVTRKLLKDGAKYFGPYMGGVNAYDLLDTINLAFSVRPCQKKLKIGKPLKPCLNHHIGRCGGICAELVSQKEYLKRVKLAIDFLNGDTLETEKLLKEKMMAFAQREEFEQALIYKEKLLGLEKVKIKRLTSLNRFLNADVLAIQNNGIYSAVNLLMIRNGRMLGGKNYAFNSGTDNSEILSEFITRYYVEGADFPQEIITTFKLADYNLLTNYFKEKLNEQISFVFPKKGVKHQLCLMAEENAKEHLEVCINKIKHKEDMTVKAIDSLKELLGLQNLPKRIECFDISNVSGVDKVASMVVFENGEPAKKEYRRFKIKTVEGANDYKSLQEVLYRRLERLKTDSEKFGKPDLIVIDGGKGQLSSVKSVFDEYKISDIDLISLAEKQEEIYTLKSNVPVVLSKSDYRLRLLIRLRDEAHRFAISYFKSLHSKNALSSVLDRIEGLGKVKIKALLSEFKDISGIISATKEQLTKVEGIGEVLAEQIISTLVKEGLKNK